MSRSALTRWGRRYKAYNNYFQAYSHRVQRRRIGQIMIRYRACLVDDIPSCSSREYNRGGVPVFLVFQL